MFSIGPVLKRFLKGVAAPAITMGLNHYIPFIPASVHALFAILPSALTQYLNTGALENSLIALVSGGLMAIEKKYLSL